MDTVSSQLISLALSFLHPAMEAVATAIGTLLAVYLYRLGSKVGIEGDAAKEAWVRTHARDIILYVEEWAAKKVTMTSQEKLDMAVTSLMKKTGVSEQVASDILHAVIVQLGLGKVNKPVVTEPSAAPLSQPVQ